MSLGLDLANQYKGRFDVLNVIIFNMIESKMCLQGTFKEHTHSASCYNIVSEI